MMYWGIWRLRACYLESDVNTQCNNSNMFEISLNFSPLRLNIRAHLPLVTMSKFYSLLKVQKFQNFVLDNNPNHQHLSKDAFFRRILRIIYLARGGFGKHSGSRYLICSLEGKRIKAPSGSISARRLY